MLSVAHLAPVMQTVLTTDADDAARDTGFIQRQRKLTGSVFVRTLVFGWLEDPSASVESLTQTCSALGIDLAPSSLDERFTPQAADCLAAVLCQALEHVLTARPAAVPLLRRFNGVHIQDSTTVSLPAALAPFLPGCGGSTPEDGAAALKLQVRWELSGCALEGLSWHAGRSADTKAELSRQFLPPGALRVADLGYFDLDTLQDYDQQGVYFLSRLPSRTVVYDGQGKKWRLAAFLAAVQGDKVDEQVEVGAKKRLPARLLAQRVPAEVAQKRRERLLKTAKKKGRKVSAERLTLCEWTVYITNAPAEKLSLLEALALGRARWQIELLFRLWKSEGHLDESRGKRPWRVLCEVFAKLLGMVVQHWVLLTAGPLLGRSAVKAARQVRKFALRLAQSVGVGRQLRRLLRQLQRRLQRVSRIKKRRRDPATIQILLNPEQMTFSDRRKT
jgi:hypothetical protein